MIKIHPPVTSCFVSEGSVVIYSKPVTLFKTALMHRTHSSCRNASENFARPRSQSFSRTLNSVVSPPCSKKSVIHFLELFSSFWIKLAYVLRVGIRRNFIKSSGSTSFNFWRSMLSSSPRPSALSLISTPPALASLFQFFDMTIDDLESNSKCVYFLNQYIPNKRLVYCQIFLLFLYFACYPRGLYIDDHLDLSLLANNLF